MPYAEYFRNASAALVIIDRGGKILEINAAAQRLFGYSREEVVGQSIELLVPDYRNTHFKGSEASAIGVPFTAVARRRNDLAFPIEISFTPLSGILSGDLLVAAFTDITERTALECEARRADNLKLLASVAAGIAHDLNNPLQAILTRSELVLDLPEAKANREIYEAAAAVHRQAQRASQIIEEFLKLFGARESKPAPIDLNEMIDRTLPLIREQMQKNNIDVETNLGSNLPRIVGDAIAIQRVLVNLLINACDAMPQGGTVMIATSLVPAAPGFLQVSVADNGPGIRPETLERIFDLRYTTKDSGSGLGLWLSRHIIQEHGGEIEVWSEIGKGTVFTIKLPFTNSPKTRQTIPVS